MDKTVVIIPAYNESNSILNVIHEINKSKLDLDIVVIDDGSQDQTRNSSLAAGTICLSHPINCGVGAALITGLTWASNSGYKQMVIVDGDGQHPIESIDSMLNLLKDSDLVVGCRDWGEFHSIKLRKLAHDLLRFVLKFKFNILTTDVTSGFRAMNIKAAHALIPTLGDQYLEDTIMLLVEAKKANLRIAEVPVTMRKRQAGEPSHGVLKSIIRFLSVLTKVIFATKGRKIND